jgi:hypothetical protein
MMEKERFEAAEKAAAQEEKDGQGGVGAGAKDEDVLSVFTRMIREQRGGGEAGAALPNARNRKKNAKKMKKKKKSRSFKLNRMREEEEESNKLGEEALHEACHACTALNEHKYQSCFICGTARKDDSNVPDAPSNAAGDEAAMVVGSKDYLLQLAGAAVVWRQPQTCTSDNRAMCNICYFEGKKREKK